jgi:AraC-like DNA-binding protein
MTNDAPFLPAIHALHLVELAARWGVTPAQLLAGSGLSEVDLAEPDETIPLPVVERLVARARALTGEPALGILLGMQMRISAHGYLGFAAMVASTLGDALEIATRFAPTRTNALALRLVVEGETAALVIDELASFGSARDVVLFALIEGIRQIGHALTGRVLTGSAEVAFSEPSYFARLAPIAGARVRFGRPENRIVFDRALLAVPLVMADPAAFRLATEQCERALATIAAATRTTARVRALLARRGGLARGLASVAKALHVSERTLKRHLAGEGTTFKDLHDEARKNEALRLVASGAASMEEIAERVGYSDVANFTRAFRRWTGKTPGAVRRGVPLTASNRSARGRRSE